MGVRGKSTVLRCCGAAAAAAAAVCDEGAGAGAEASPREEVEAGMSGRGGGWGCMGRMRMRMRMRRRPFTRRVARIRLYCLIMQIVRLPDKWGRFYRAAWYGFTFYASGRSGGNVESFIALGSTVTATAVATTTITTTTTTTTTIITISAQLLCVTVETRQS
ncbi:hypothetical protein M0802_005472 [Mischocyttarus mexicanus]|nr:hypothetical protein M0802_005472 [Mischocyttarus mexicanus]